MKKMVIALLVLGFIAVQAVSASNSIPIKSNAIFPSVEGVDVEQLNTYLKNDTSASLEEPTSITVIISPKKDLMVEETKLVQKKLINNAERFFSTMQDLEGLDRFEAIKSECQFANNGYPPTVWKCASKLHKLAASRRNALSEAVDVSENFLCENYTNYRMGQIDIMEATNNIVAKYKVEALKEWSVLEPSTWFPMSRALYKRKSSFNNFDQEVRKQTAKRIAWEKENGEILFLACSPPSESDYSTEYKLP